MIRTVVRAAVGSLILLHTISAVARSQEALAFVAEGVTRGEPVRAYAPAIKKGPCKGRFEAVRSDSLVILSGGRPCALPLYAVERVDRRTDRESNPEAVLRGSLWGAGSAAGIIYFMACHPGGCFRGLEGMGIVHTVAALAAVPGAIVGGLIAVANPKERWENVWPAEEVAEAAGEIP